MAAEVLKTKRAHGIATQRTLLAAAATVFSRVAYAEARLRDIADEAGISQGSLYFHFGNKDDVASAILAEQQERMTAVLSHVLGRPGSALDKILELFERLADLVANDVIVQAGIRLSMQPATGFENDSSAPYVEWIGLTSTILKEGVLDGSMAPDLDTRASADLLNQIFVGAQTLSGLEDRWASLPRRVASARAGIRLLLTVSLL
jgi:AcrR family transcriptional regulator